MESDNGGRGHWSEKTSALEAAVDNWAFGLADAAEVEDNDDDGLMAPDGPDFEALAAEDGVITPAGVFTLALL